MQVYIIMYIHIALKYFYFGGLNTTNFIATNNLLQKYFDQSKKIECDTRHFAPKLLRALICQLHVGFESG